MKPKKILYLLVALLLAFNPVFSQKKEITVVQKESVVGKNLFNGSDIKGVEYVFSDKVYNYFVDTATHLLTVQLRNIGLDGVSLKNKGAMVQYDIINDQILWTKEIDYSMTTILQISNAMIYRLGRTSYNIDVYTGNHIWETASIIFFFDLINKIAMGTLPFSDIVLDGIDFSNGKPLWNRIIKNKYGLNNYFLINDSTMLIVANGLHTVNIYNGKGWSYFTETGEVSFFIGFCNNIVSNALIDSSSVFLAAKNEIFKIDIQSGNLLWQNYFPEKWASKSSIFSYDTTIYMINKGYVNLLSYGYSDLKYGKPFIAAFDKQTGEQRYLKFADHRGRFIQSFGVFGDALFLVFSDKISKFDLKTGNLISEKVFKRKEIGELKYFASERVFMTNYFGNMQFLPEHNFPTLHVFNDFDELLTIDDQFKVTNIVKKKDIWIYYFGSKDLAFFYNESAIGNNTLVINNDGEKIAELKLSSKAFFSNDVVYDIKGRNFIAIDFQDIISSYCRWLTPNE